MSNKPFYGKQIDPDLEQEKIERLLAPLKGLPVDEELKEKAYKLLAHAKHKEEISIPFSIEIREDPSGVRASYLEVRLETKV